jgi:predicted transcriptional regulator
MFITNFRRLIEVAKSNAQKIINSNAPIPSSGKAMSCLCGFSRKAVSGTYITFPTGKSLEKLLPVVDVLIGRVFLHAHISPDQLQQQIQPAHNTSK